MSCKCVALGVGAESRTALPSLRTGENPNTKTTSKELEGLHFSLHLFYWSAVWGLKWLFLVKLTSQRAGIQCTSTLPATGYSNRVLQEKQSSTPVIAAFEQQKTGILEAQ